MANERRVSFEIATDADDTHFNIFYRSVDQDDWIGLYTTALPPAESAPEDLPKSLITSGVFFLDGINGPTGNMAAASRAGNQYRLRLRTSGGYGNSSPVFAVEYSPDTDGPLADVYDIIQLFRFRTTVFRYRENPEFHAFLAEHQVQAMDFIRLTAGIDELYTGSRTSREARVLRRVEMLYAAAAAVRQAAFLKVHGIHAPLMAEDSERALALAAAWQTEGDLVLASLKRVLGITDPVAGLPALGVGSLTPVSPGEYLDTFRPLWLNETEWIVQ